MKVSAYHIGERFHVKKILKIPGIEFVNRESLFFKYKEYRVIAFKYGVLVFIHQNKFADKRTLKFFRKYVESPFPVEEVASENIDLNTKSKEDMVMDGKLCVSHPSREFEMVLGIILARSVVIEKYEKAVQAQLIRLEEVLDAFEKTGGTKLSSKRLLQMSGEAMKLRNSLFSRLSLLDKPDFTWEDAYVDQWYKALDSEYELSERYEVLSKKIDALFGDVEFILNYIETRKMFFLEIAIVLLFVMDIVVLIAEYF